MSDHAKAAEELAERAGGYLSAFEGYADDPVAAGETPAAAYAQAATAAAVLSVAQRLAELAEDDEPELTPPLWARPRPVPPDDAA